MLESPVLLLRDSHNGSPPEVTGRPRVSVFDAGSGLCVGTVQGAPLEPSWYSWLFPSAWEVVETEDHALVFTLRRSWRFSNRWYIRDSEGRRVGSVIEPGRLGGFAQARIQDAFGRRIADLVSQDVFTSVFLGPVRTELGSLSQCGDEMRLTFAESAAENPFTRMLLLAAALIRA
jgi:hypothetical protein